jgi:hypothetical protein
MKAILDINKIKRVMTEMQFQVSKNSVKISSDMIDQTRLSINLELMRDELDERVSGKLLTFETQIKAKVKKRLK